MKNTQHSQTTNAAPRASGAGKVRMRITLPSADMAKLRALTAKLGLPDEGATIEALFARKQPPRSPDP